jgi:hypothetical protein
LKREFRRILKTGTCFKRFGLKKGFTSDIATL